MYNNEDINSSSPDRFFPADESNMEARLWAYMDGLSDEASFIEKLIADNEEWKTKYAELLEVHQLMMASELEQPSLRFTKNIMEEIARYQIAPAAKKYINKKIVWGLAAFFMTIFVGFLIYGFAQVNWAEAGSTSSPIGIDLGAVNYSQMFNNSFVNGFMMLNVILGLLLLDRYLNSKKKIREEGYNY